MNIKRAAVFLLLFQAVSLFAQELAARYNFQDFTQTPQKIKTLTIEPLFSFGVNGTNIVTGDRRTFVTDTSGSKIVSNILAGYSYRVTLAGSYSTTVITNYFGTNVTGLVSASDPEYLTVSTNLNDSLTAYSKAQADARFAPIGSGGSATNVLQVAAGTGISVDTNSLVRTVKVDTNVMATVEKVAAEVSSLSNSVPYITVSNAATAATAFSLNTTNFYFNAADYIAATANGGLAIQAAINAASNSTTTARYVYVPKRGPDTSTNVWLVTEPIIVPSWLTLENDGYVRLAPLITNNILRNASALSGDSTRDHDITICGTGTFDGAPEDQHIYYPQQWKSHGFVFYKVDRLRVEGVRIRATSYGICPEDVTEARFLNLDFKQIGNFNQACIQAFGPLTNIVISGIMGISRDDCIAICAGGGSVDSSGRITGQGPGGNVRNVRVSGVNTELSYLGAGFRTMGSSNSLFTLQDVYFSDCHFTGAGGNLITIGWSDTVAKNGTGGQTNIVFDNISGTATNHFVYYECPADGVVLRNLKGTCAQNFVAYNGDATPRYGLTVENCEVTSTGANKTWLDTRGNVGKVIVRNSVARSTGGSGQVFFLPQLSSGGNYSLQVLNDGFASDALINTTVPTSSNIVRLAVTHLNGTNTWTGTFPTAGVVYNGVAWETANADTPQRTNYNAGDFVNFTDSGDASGTGMYMRLASGEWKLIPDGGGAGDVAADSNNTFTGDNTHSGTETFSGTVVLPASTVGTNDAVLSEWGDFVDARTIGVASFAEAGKTNLIGIDENTNAIAIDVATLVNNTNTHYLAAFINYGYITNLFVQGWNYQPSPVTPNGIVIDAKTHLTEFATNQSYTVTGFTNVGSGYFEPGLMIRNYGATNIFVTLPGSMPSYCTNGINPGGRLFVGWLIVPTGTNACTNVLTALFP